MRYTAPPTYFQIANRVSETAGFAVHALANVENTTLRRAGNACTVLTLWPPGSGN